MVVNPQRRESNPRERRTPMRLATLPAWLGKVSIVLAVAALAACATGTILRWNQVDAGALMQGDAGKQSYNVIRFETFGPRAEQIFGYVLYKDGIEVVTGGGIPVARLGRKTLQEVMADHEQQMRSRMFAGGSRLIVREFLRGGSVAALTASDLNMDVQLWDITQGDGPPVLRLVYRDLRREPDSPDPTRPQRRGF